MCPKCGAPLGEVTETSTGKKLQRCSTGSWNSETRQAEGCDYVKWLKIEPEKLDEKCPLCGADVLLITTRSGKAKKCSTATWDPATKQAGGCTYFEWFNGSQKELDEICPKCGAKLLFVTTANGKQMKKCSTAGWDREKKEATGCDYVEWMKSESKQKPLPKAVDDEIPLPDDMPF